MLGEIRNLTKKNYGYDYSNPVEESFTSIIISTKIKVKDNQSKTDFFFPTTNNNKNISYSQFGKIIYKLNKDESSKTDFTKVSDENKKTESTSNKKELKPEEKKQSEELKRIDSLVKAHEQAHMSAGGGLVRGGASYQYQKGPDGQMYAVGGEVEIDISPVSGNPDGTIAKMEQVKKAALAPSDPSGQDRQVAVIATQIESQALVEKQKLSVSAASNNKVSIKFQTAEVTKLNKSYIYKYFQSSNFNSNSKLNVIVR
jgi:hypothetical protein